MTASQACEKTHLLGEDGLDHGGVGVGHGINVGDDGNAGLGDGHSGENLLELANSGLHEVSVESSSHGEGDCHACLEIGLGDLVNLGAGSLGARHGVVSRAEVVGDLDLASGKLSCLGAESLDSGDVKADDANHSALLGLRGSLHGLSANLDNPEAILEADGTREAKSGVLAKAEACSTKNKQTQFAC
jgi:hypothetical protein